MPKASRILVVLGLSLFGLCHSQDLSSAPESATPTTGNEPASVSYQDLQVQKPAESVAQDAAAEADEASEPVAVPAPSKKKLKLKSSKVKKQMELAPASQIIEDPAKLRAEGERQHSKGVAMQVFGAILVPTGIILIAMNMDGYEKYADGDKEGNGGAYALTLIGEVVATAGVVGIIVGASMRKNGTRKIDLAERAEFLSFRERHNIMVLPVASFENRAGGVVVAGTF